MATFKHFERITIKNYVCAVALAPDSQEVFFIAQRARFVTAVTSYFYYFQYLYKDRIQTFEP